MVKKMEMKREKERNLEREKWFFGFRGTIFLFWRGLFSLEKVYRRRRRMKL